MAVITGSVSRNPGRYTYQLVCEEINLDTANNTSQLQVTVQIVTGGTSGTTYATRSATASHIVTGDGITYYFSTGSYSLIGQTTTTLGTITSNTITHDSDGTKTVSVSASSPDLAQGGGYGPYSGSASGSVTLTQLHKAPLITGYSITELNTALTNAGVANNVFVKNLSVKRFTLSGSDVTFYDGATHSSTKVWNLMSGQTNIPGTPNVVEFDFSQKELKLAENNKAPIAINVIDNTGAGSTYPSNSSYDLYNTILYEKVTLTDTNTYAKRYGQLSGRVNINVKGTYYNGSVGNVNQGGTYKPTIKYKFWKLGTSEPASYSYTIPPANITISNGTYSVTNYDIGSTTEGATNYFDPDYAYRVKFQVNDNFTPSVVSTEKSIPVGEATWTEYKDRVDFKKITIEGVNPFEYSTNEKKVGIWITGKPIYKKTIELSSEIALTELTWVQIQSVSSLNVNMIINCEVMNDNYYLGSFFTKVDNGYLYVMNTCQYGWGGKYFTIYYTKTTD